MKRLLLLALALAALTGCSRWEIYKATAVRTVHIDLSSTGMAGGYNHEHRIVAFDPAQLARMTPLEREYSEAHEYGHAVALDLGLSVGAGSADQERAANCVAEAVTGRQPPWVLPSLGYDNCPDAEARRVRALMVARGWL